MITNNGSPTSYTFSGTSSQNMSASSQSSQSITTSLASLTPVLQGEGVRRTLMDSDQMSDVDMTTPLRFFSLNPQKMDVDSEIGSKKRAADVDAYLSDSVDSEPAIFRPAKRRGAIGSLGASRNDDAIQGKKPAEVLADELSGLCKLSEK